MAASAHQVRAVGGFDESSCTISDLRLLMMDDCAIRAEQVRGLLACLPQQSDHEPLLLMNSRPMVEAHASLIDERWSPYQGADV